MVTFVLFVGECTRHDHGRGAGVCHSAQYNWQTALRPGITFVSFVLEFAKIMVFPDNVELENT